MTGGSILVTGSAGRIGSHTVQQLLASGEKVVVLDNLGTGFRQAVDGAGNRASTTWTESSPLQLAWEERQKREPWR